MSAFDRESRQLINKARNLGGKGPAVYLEDRELLRLCIIVAFDLDRQDLVKSIMANEDAVGDYYAMPLEWFNQPVSDAVVFAEIYLLLKQEIQDFETYFGKLCELHKRRVKFKHILETQAFSIIEPIAPRCLLEYGLMPTETLASWLVWRKWLYDIDNRSAQETGYLFEPILAAAIGGVPYSAKVSPIKRADSPGNGRQVDCLDGRLAYEFKMRVTPAASGQGRFKEELDFARDCSESSPGYTPILLVLDPTSSARLNDLMAEYVRYGGYAYVGSEAWKHIEEKAGSVMGKFVEKYVRTPLKEIDRNYKSLPPIQLVATDDKIVVQLGSQSLSIYRSEPKVDYENSQALDVADE